MKTTSRLSLALLLLISAAVAAPLQAETVSFPKDKPALAVDLPSGWKADFIEAGVIPGGARLQLQSEGGAADLAIKTLPDGAGITDDASAKANFTKVAMQDMKEMEATKCDDPEETTIAGNKAYKGKVMTGLGPMEYTVFTPDGKTYFSMFSMNGGAAPVIAAIKPAG